VVEKVVSVPTTLITEMAVEVPQVQVIEVLKQTASNSQQQRIVQTGVQWQQPVARELVVERTEAARSAGTYEADVVSVREGACVQPTVVERQNPILTQEFSYAGAMGTRTVMESVAVADPMAMQGTRVIGSGFQVKEVHYQGVKIPVYEIHHLRAMQPAQLRSHAEYLYRAVGHGTLGSAVPMHDHLLIDWILGVHSVHLHPLLPMATTGIDTTGDGRANIVYTGVDLNRNGIPDELEQRARPAVSIVTGPMF
jgi:hypothetical protein